MLPVLLNILYWGAILYVLFRVVYRPPAKGRESLLIADSGTRYTVVVGDNLSSYAVYGRFNGIDVSLPIDLPHIYLDSLKAGGRQVDAVFDKSQRISLEGDFNTYFNVFVPQSYEFVALSILSPDVMQTLRTYAAQFDVEIYGSHLRVITDQKVSTNASLQAEMVDIARKILKEIEDRKRSWSRNNSLQSIEQDLFVYPEKGFRRFNRYFTWQRFWLSIFWFMCIMPFALGGGAYLWMHNYVGAGIMLAISIAVYAGLQVFTGSMQATTRFHSRHGSKPPQML